MNESNNPPTIQSASPPSLPDQTKITVSGVTFGAKDVVSAVVKIGGRKIHISEPEEEDRKIGFAA